MAMRKLVLLAVLGALGLAVWPEATSACWRHRRARCCPLPSYALCPQTPPRHFPAKAVLSTEQFLSPAGRVHRLHTIDDVGWQEPVPLKGAPQPKSLATAPASDAETFAGHDREAAKTSIANAAITFFAELSRLL